MLRRTKKCRGTCSIVKDQAIVDEVTWIGRLVEIKIKSQTQNALQDEDQVEKEGSKGPGESE